MCTSVKNFLKLPSNPSELDLTALTVSCTNLASSILALSSLSLFNSYVHLRFPSNVSLRTPSFSVVNVEGIMLGKSFNATGRRNSMKGTIIKIEKGIRRMISEVVVTNSLLSRRESFLPLDFRNHCR